jgi:thymidylate kinase
MEKSAAYESFNDPVLQPEYPSVVPSETSFQHPANDHEAHNRAYENCVAHGIKGLYSSFYTAVTILRIARELGELDESLGEEPDSVESFYHRLNTVEKHLNDDMPRFPPFIVLIEGLDGCGKSTLVKRLANTPPPPEGRFTWSAVSTPTASMAAVRDVFDKRGGAVARAFYMASNYMLQQEIREECIHLHNAIFVVDRWYASTCAYSVAWKNTTGGPESIDQLDESLFQWPKDLMRPDIFLLLHVDDSTRRDRVTARRQQSQEGDSYNPWDDRLNHDEYLGRRIFRALERLQGPREVLCLDANQTPDQVLHDAVSLVHDRAMRHFYPMEYFRRQPLQFLRWTSAKLGLCDDETGSRRPHAPWYAHMSLSISGQVPPSLRTVEIHAVDPSGFLFFTSKVGASETRDTSDDNDFKQDVASLAWIGGDYPYQLQWQAEGILCPATMEECRLMNQAPSPSLVAQNVACCQAAQDQYCSGMATTKPSCARLPRNLQETLLDARQNEPSFPDEATRFVAATRFVPLRLEVLIGDPASQDDSQRWEWRRDVQSGQDGWSKAESFVPLSPLQLVNPTVTCSNILPMTLVLTGTHCSGKATLGKKLAHVLGWHFQAELGETLRSDQLMEGGHRLGDGSGSNNASSWDELVHTSETLRDQNSEGCRVVETWHMGNLAWSLFRINALPEASSSVPHEDFVRLARDSIQEAMHKSVVLWVHLSVTLSTVLRRRKENAACTDRVPLANEVADCKEMHLLLGERNVEEELQIHDIPRLALDNNLDGDQAMTDRLREILAFIHLHQWRRGMRP